MVFYHKDESQCKLHELLQDWLLFTVTRYSSLSPNGNTDIITVLCLYYRHTITSAFIVHKPFLSSCPSVWTSTKFPELKFKHLNVWIFNLKNMDVAHPTWQLHIGYLGGPGIWRLPNPKSPNPETLTPRKTNAYIFFLHRRGTRATATYFWRTDEVREALTFSLSLLPTSEVHQSGNLGLGACEYK